MALFEIVPNLSEGSDDAVIDRAERAATNAGAHVLHRTSDATHNRSVLTIVGNAKAIVDAAVGIAAVAVEAIDLRTHRGVHPRIGALDVLPFVPLEGSTMREAAGLAQDAAERIWAKYRVPTFYYGAVASTPQRRLLASVRAGEFEGLENRFNDPAMRPDVGDIARHESAGAIAIGARDLLVAFNVNLATPDLALARSIATRLRERTGGLCTLRALGFALSDGAVQVSLNVTDHEATPLYRIVELVRRLAAEAGVEIKRSELIGCIPRRAVENAARYYLGV
jgi:glutamate formiminotransferase